MYAALRPDAVLTQALATLPAMVVVHVWRVLRLLDLWTRESPAGRTGLFGGEELRALEYEILTGGYCEGLRAPLAVIVDLLATDGPADAQRIARACMCVVDWACGTGRPAIAVAFVRAAAGVAGIDRFRLVAELLEVNLVISAAGAEPHPTLIERRRVLLDRFSALSAGAEA